MILSSDRMVGNMLSLKELQLLNKVILKASLFECMAKGLHFTWNSKARNKTKNFSKLYMIFINQTALSAWPDMIYNILPSSLSDHSPLIISFGSKFSKPPSTFIFFNSWTLHPEFPSIISNAWLAKLFGSPMFILQSQLKHTKSILKLWSR